MNIVHCYKGIGIALHSLCVVEVVDALPQPQAKPPGTSNVISHDNHMIIT